MEHCIAATLLLLIQQCLCNFPDLSQKAPRSERNITDQLKPLLRAAIIKQEILRHLGIADSPRYHQTTPTYKEKKTNQESDDRLTPYKMTNVASYHSEPPGMCSFTFTSAYLLRSLSDNMDKTCT